MASGPDAGAAPGRAVVAISRHSRASRRRHSPRSIMASMAKATELDCRRPRWRVHSSTNTGSAARNQASGPSPSSPRSQSRKSALPPMSCRPTPGSQPRWPRGECGRLTAQRERSSRSAGCREKGHAPLNAPDPEAQAISATRATQRQTVFFTAQQWAGATIASRISGSPMSPAPRSQTARTILPTGWRAGRHRINRLVPDHEPLHRRTPTGDAGHPWGGAQALMRT